MVISYDITITSENNTRTSTFINFNLTIEPIASYCFISDTNNSRDLLFFFFLAACTIGVLRASEIGAVDFSLEAEDAATEDEDNIALCSSLPQPPKKILIEIRQMPKMESGEHRKTSLK